MISKTTPEIEGTTTCFGNPCKIKIPIPHEYTFCGDIITVTANAIDKCGQESGIAVASTNVEGAVIGG